MTPLLGLKSPVVPIAAANNSFDQEEAALKIGSFTMCCFKTLIAARTAMGGSFAPATAIITGNTSTTTPKLPTASGYRSSPVPGLHFSDYRGGLNGSTQHSARTRIALKTRAKSAHQVRITQNAILAWVLASRSKQVRLPGEVIVGPTDQMVLHRPSELAAFTRHWTTMSGAFSLSTLVA